jgi:tetratricopeptide (TPR) repeat protein
LLITSRFSDWGQWAEEVTLDVMPLPEAERFLEYRAARRDSAGARILAQALGGLPLALDHAASFCRRTQMGFSEYAAKAEDFIAAAPHGVVYPKSVGVTFDLAINEAIAHCPSDESLVSYLAHCAPERIPMTLVRGAIEDEAQRLEAVATLAEVSLLRHDQFEDGAPAVSMHRLVQAVARARAEAKGESEASIERLIVRLAAIYPKDGRHNPNSWMLCNRLTPHVLALEYMSADSVAKRTSWPDVLGRVGDFLHGRGAYAAARPLLERALTIREKALGPEHPQTADGLNNLAVLLYDQGGFTAARPLLERALAIREKALGPEHPETAESLNWLATLLYAQGDFTAARPLCERALAIREKALGPEHPKTAESLNWLGILLHARGDLTAARPLFERALAVREKVFGPEHPETADSLNWFAMLLRAVDLVAARSLYERALAIRERVLGPEHPKTAENLNNLAVVMAMQGDYSPARSLFERAMAIWENLSDPIRAAKAAGNLGAVLRAQGDLTAARRLLERALAILEKTLGADHIDTRVCRGQLASLPPPWMDGAIRLVSGAISQLRRIF